jgi:hypothetical protein
MATDAKEFLHGWVQSYVFAEARGVEQIDQTVEECVDDAKGEGLTRKDLDAAAGGDLRGYLLDFIITMNE